MKSIRRAIQSMMSLIMISFGALLASFSVACILLPNDAIDYGTAGIAIIISKLTGYKLSLCVLVVFLPFLIAGLFMLGKRFFLRAAIGSLVYMVGLDYFEKMPFELNVEHFIAVAFGGAILSFPDSPLRRLYRRVGDPGQHYCLKAFRKDQEELQYDRRPADF